MILALKVAVIVVITGNMAFIGRYTRRTRGAAWRDPIGLALIMSAVLAIGEVVPFGLAVFFRLSTLGSRVGAWVFIVFLLLGGAWLWWRFIVWGRSDPERKASQ